MPVTATFDSPFPPFSKRSCHTGQKAQPVLTTHETFCYAVDGYHVCGTNTSFLSIFGLKQLLRCVGDSLLEFCPFTSNARTAKKVSYQSASNRISRCHIWLWISSVTTLLTGWACSFLFPSFILRNCKVIRWKWQGAVCWVLLPVWLHLPRW